MIVTLQTDSSIGLEDLEGQPIKLDLGVPIDQKNFTSPNFLHQVRFHFSQFSIHVKSLRREELVATPNNEYFVRQNQCGNSYLGICA